MAVKRPVHIRYSSEYSTLYAPHATGETRLASALTLERLARDQPHTACCLAPNSLLSPKYGTDPDIRLGTNSGLNLRPRAITGRVYVTVWYTSDPHPLCSDTPTKGRQITRCTQSSVFRPDHPQDCCLWSCPTLVPLQVRLHLMPLWPPDALIMCTDTSFLLRCLTEDTLSTTVRTHHGRRLREANRCQLGCCLPFASSM